MRKLHFTMLEMVAVLIIITVVSLLALRSFHAGDNLASAHGNALLNYLSTAHNRAMSEGKTVEIFWDKEAHAWRGNPKNLSAPDNVSVKIADTEPEPEETVFRFFADGGAEAVKVELSSPGESVQIRTLPLSGNAELLTATSDETPAVEPLWIKKEELH